MATFWNLGRRTHFFAQSPQHLTNRRGSQWLPTERQSWRWQLIHSAVEHVAMTWPPPGSFFTMIYNETDQWWSSQWAQYGTGLLIISHKATDLWQTSKQTNKTNSWTNDKASKQSNKQCNGASTFVIVGYCVNHTVWFPFPIPISTPATIFRFPFANTDSFLWHFPTYTVILQGTTNALPKVTADVK